MSLLDDERALSQRYEANWMAEKERAEKAEAEVDRLRAALERLRPLVTGTDTLAWLDAQIGRSS